MSLKSLFTFLFVIACGYPAVFAQQKIRYDLYIQDTTVTYGGKEKRAIAANGSIPMPTLTFTEGDTAQIVVHNQSNEPTALHWHGVQLPNKEDGVPFLTQNAIKPGESFTYEFPVIQNGTYWYHSHSGFQEQIGLYGSLIFHKRKKDPTFRKGIDDLPEIPVLLSEWSNQKPEEIQRMLAIGNDWFAIKKNTVQSYFEALTKGHLKTKLINEWKRMEAMDVSDVYYERFLINGQTACQLKQFKAGDKVRLRIANGGGSTYFWLTYAGGKFTVVANDGNDVEPVEVDRLIIGVSETYDIVVTIPAANTSYELLATAEDRTGEASLFMGNGVKQLTQRLPRLHYFEGMKMMNDMMKMNGNMNDMGMKMSLQKMDMNTVMYPEMQQQNAESHQHSGHHSMPDHSSATMKDAPSEKITLNYDLLKATSNTSFDKNAPVKELKFELTGNMNRYMWSMNNKVLSEVDKIPVKKDEILRIVLYNNSMMRHPMHLHGFDFRVLNKFGDYAPLKNVLDIMPMETDTIEFKANTEGDWFFHCHILYHMMAGMDRVFSVGNYKNPYLHHPGMSYKMLQMESNMKYFTLQNDFASNGNDGDLKIQNTRWEWNTEWRLGYTNKNGYEVETHIGRYMDRMQWLMPFVGFDYRYRKFGHDEQEKNIFGQTNKKDHRKALSVGVVYTLPMLIHFQTELYHDGIVRFTLQREDIPLTKRFRGGFMVNTDKEYMGELRYILTKHLAARGHYDSDMGWGIGLNVRY